MRAKSSKQRCPALRKNNNYEYSITYEIEHFDSSNSLMFMHLNER